MVDKVEWTSLKDGWWNRSREETYVHLVLDFRGAKHRGAGAIDISQASVPTGSKMSWLKEGLELYMACFCSPVAGYQKIY